MTTDIDCTFLTHNRKSADSRIFPFPVFSSDTETPLIQLEQQQLILSGSFAAPCRYKLPSNAQGFFRLNGLPWFKHHG